jgi:AcrR family transcriptional regulator
MTPRPSDAADRQRRRYAPRLPPRERREQLLDAALSVIVQRGYEGVSIEAIARTAGVTRPVIYDHFPNLGRLLQALIEREERDALEQLAVVLPDLTGEGEPAELFAAAVERFLDGVVTWPDNWRIILLAPYGTPPIVREHVERNRARVLARIEAMVRWAIDRSTLPAELDVELCARAIRSLSEEAGRMLLTDSERYSPKRYRRFVRTFMDLIWSDSATVMNVPEVILRSTGTRFQGSPPSTLAGKHSRPG